MKQTKETVDLKITVPSTTTPIAKSMQSGEEKHNLELQNMKPAKDDAVPGITVPPTSTYTIENIQPDREDSGLELQPVAAFVISSLKVDVDNPSIELRVYRKWLLRTISQKKDRDFCCILLDVEGNVVQATMDPKNTTYFDQQLQLNSVYKISKYFCVHTDPFQQTLQNTVSLRFGKITTFELLPGKETEFPAHYFEFVSYNQLHSKIPYRDEKSKMVYPIITDYLGVIWSISDVITSGDVNTGLKFRRKIDIENIDGKVVEFTMWDAVAQEFPKLAVEKLERPITIVVTSCSVSTFRDMLQLNATQATHYYVRPKCREATELLSMFKDKYTDTLPMQVINYRYKDPTQEKERNRQTLQTLLQHNPDTFKDVRFTCMATITSIISQKDWRYPSCPDCKKPAKLVDGSYVCEDHGLQEPTFFRYNFKATVADGTGTAEFTFFTEAGKKLIGSPCSDISVQSVDNKKPPQDLTKTIGRTHIFQIQYSSNTKTGAGQFIVNDILDVQAPDQRPTEDTQHDSVQENVQMLAVKSDDTQGTPPRDVIEELAATIVSTIPRKPGASQAPNPTKRSLANEFMDNPKKSKEN